MASEPGIVFHMLGPIEIRVEGRSIPLPGGYARSILGLLLLHPNRILSPDDLIDALWRDNPPRTAPNVLQAHVVSLRRALRVGGEGLVTRLETHPSGYRLRVEPQELDSELFEAEVADAERLASGNPAAAIDALRRGLVRWRGPVEAGGTESSLAVGSITRLEELRLGASETLAELNLRLGRARDAAADLEPLAREHPFRERFHALLMIALYRTGRQADALAAYRTARDALVNELGVEPGPELRALELAILRQEPGLMGIAPGVPATLDAGPIAASNAAPAAMHDMPSIDTSFVGRNAELASVVELLGAERLITVTGVGGSGKTRFAIEAAAMALERFPGGIWFVDLTPVPDGERMQLAVAAGLGLAEQVGRGILETVIEGLGDTRRLLILDNCEHVVEPCARFAEALLEGAKGLSILATSREPLRLSTEVLWRLAPLDLAAEPTLGGGDPAAPEAVRLMLDRASRVRPGRAWTDADLQAMAEICHRLDGLPLAIEMAAARLRVLEPQDVLDRLDDRFRLLTDGGRTAIPRHRTLRATLDWSYELLDEGDQAVLRRMSAFATPIPPAAVEAICGGPEIDAVEAVVRLADRSLAITSVGPDGRSRFGLLDTVREYGRVQLRASGEEEAIARRHLAYWTAFATAAFERRHDDRDRQADALEREVGELRLALDRAHTLDVGVEMALAGRLGWFWTHHTHLTEGRRLLDRALSGAGGDELDRARCLCAAGALAAIQGEASSAFEAMDTGLAILRRRGETVEECAALDDYGWGKFFLGDLDGAEEVFERAVQLAELSGIPGLLRRANAGLGQVLVAKGDVGRAQGIAEQLLRIAGGDLWTTHLAHHYLADCAMLAGNPGEALASYKVALDLANRMGNVLETAIEVQGVAIASAGVGDPELAVRLNGAAEAAFAGLGVVVEVQFWIALLERYLGPAREALGPRADSIDRDGRSLALEDAVREGLTRSAAAAGPA